MKHSIWGNLFKPITDDDESITYLLAKTSVFENLGKSDLLTIERIVHVRHYDEGEVVFREGEPGVGLYIVKSGEVKVSIRDPETKEELSIATFTSGQAFGDVALFSEEAVRTASVTVSRKSTLLGFCRPDLVNLIERDPLLGSQILMNLLNIAGQRLDENNKHLNQAENKIVSLEKQLQESNENS